MSGVDYERLKRLILEARAIPRDERAAWLDRACAGDAELRAEAAALLDHEEAADPRLGTGVAPDRFAGELSAALGAPADAIPERIGPYRVLERIGTGGMGAVYRAEQSEPLRREVAIKLVRPGFGSAEVLARFEAERSTLARMEHPFIASVLDAGRDAAAGPYFVMELVRGEPITVYCDRHRLPVAERLRLFLMVCEAVQHAHHKGVLHRDLKPSNVLVIREQDRPIPKVIDFGIARVYEGEAVTPGGGPLTVGAAFLGTPEYMSPEQAGLVGDGVDTRTDVYSLGVLLYELLSGHRPFRFRSDRPVDVLRSLASDEPGRPSTAVTGAGPAPRAGERPAHRRPGEGDVAADRGTTRARLRRQLAGDLDAIVLKALRREPRHRYPSVEHVADDLRRYLDGRPVSARRGGWTYQVGRFSRRHPVGVTAAAGVTVALVAVAVVSAVQSARLARARDRAVAAERRARAEAGASREVSAFLRGLFQAANPVESRGEPVTARQLVDRGAARIEEELSGQPGLQGRLMRELGEVYHSLGLYAQADTLLRRALEHLDADSVSGAADRAAALEMLGVVAQDRGDLETAERRYREAIALLRGIEPRPDADLARNLNTLAGALQQRGDLAAAEPLFRESLEMMVAEYGPRHEEVAWATGTLGWVLHQQGHYAQAESLYRAALEVQVEILGERHPDVGHTLNNLAGVRWHLGDYAEAEALWRRAYQIYRALYPDGHPAVTRAMFNLARVLRSRGAILEADSLYAESLDQARTQLGRDHPAYAIHLVGLAGSRLDRGRPAEAERLLREAIALRREAGAGGTTVAAGDDELLALTQVARGRPAEAVRLARRALGARLELQGSDHPDVAGSLVCLGRARAAGGDVTGADSTFAAALALRRQVLGEGHPLTLEAGVYLGLLRLGNGGRAAARELLAGAESLPERLPLRAQALDSLAAMLDPGR